MVVRQPGQALGGPRPGRRRRSCPPRRPRRHADVVVQTARAGRPRRLGADRGRCWRPTPPWWSRRCPPSAATVPTATAPARPRRRRAVGPGVAHRRRGPAAGADHGAAVQATSQRSKRRRTPVVALHHASRTGQGQHVDVAALPAMVRTLMNATEFRLLQGLELPPAALPHGVLAVPGPQGVRLRRRARDVHGRARPTRGRPGDRCAPWPRPTATRFPRRSRRRRVRPGHWLDLSQARTGRGARRGHRATVDAVFAPAPRPSCTRPLSSTAAPVAPVNTVADLRADEQLAARDYFGTTVDRPRTGRDGVPRRARGPGSSATPWPRRPGATRRRARRRAVLPRRRDDRARAGRSAARPAAHRSPG